MIPDRRSAALLATTSCSLTNGGFEHQPDRRGFWNVTPDERKALWDELYATPGFAILAANFPEIYMDEAANREISDYVASRIRERVNDPAVAEKLIPKDHGFGTKRVPMETRYYEAYNRDNVELVDLQETPIERVTATGMQTSDTHREFDLIVYATGFDAITGAYDRIEFVGADGETLAEKWKDGPINYLGVGAAGFPNLIMVNGPTAGSATTNFPRGIEASVDWTTDLMAVILEGGHTRVEVTTEKEDEWVAHIRELYDMLLINQTTSWMNGYNSNVEGREEGGRFVIYAAGLPRYRDELEEVAEAGYPGFVME